MFATILAFLTEDTVVFTMVPVVFTKILALLSAGLIAFAIVLAFLSADTIVFVMIPICLSKDSEILARRYDCFYNDSGILHCRYRLVLVLLPVLLQ